MSWENLVTLEQTLSQGLKLIQERREDADSPFPGQKSLLSLTGSITDGQLAGPLQPWAFLERLSHQCSRGSFKVQEVSCDSMLTRAVTSQPEVYISNLE